MKLYCENNQFTLYNGSMLDMLEAIEPNSIDSIVTDPPYELNFMNKGWDNSGIAFQKETWEKCFTVLKSGGYLLAFGGSRTFHRIACAIEDAGFEIRDTIMWIYGCLSEDTEVLTKSGFKQFHKLTEDDIIRVYDIESGIYKWEKPKRWNVYKTEQDTCYRIKSDCTDQLVSRNHRCLVERDGVLVFEYAENLREVERVPVLSYDIPYLQESEGNILFTDLLWQDERVVKGLLSEWKGEKESEKISLRARQPILEWWCNIPQEKRELFKSKYQICEVSEGIYNDGEKRWLCDGTSSISGTSNSTTFIKDRGCSPYQSQCGGQQIRKSDVVCDKSRPQELRVWKTYKTTVATITKEEYSGIIYCPTVSTGCFVARRNGKVFITGNSGFPKSMNIGLAIDKKNGVESEIEGKRWSGWGTAMKPAYEPIIVARKPCEGSCVDNVLKYGVGGINIDECRVPMEQSDVDMLNAKSSKNPTSNYNQNEAKKYGDYALNIATPANEQGRFPANVILTYDETDKDEVCGGFPYTKSSGGSTTMPDFIDAGRKNSYNKVGFNDGETATRKQSSYVSPMDEGSASRYFYCAKASKKDRDEGLDAFQEHRKAGYGYDIGLGCAGEGMFKERNTQKRNTHPTVKPTELMQYLVRLVTPNGGTVLDPFNGSGSTGKACMYENRERNKDYKYIGIELSEEYLPIARARIEFACSGELVEEVTENVVKEKPAVPSKVILW